MFPLRSLAYTHSLSSLIFVLCSIKQREYLSRRAHLDLYVYIVSSIWRLCHVETLHPDSRLTVGELP